MSYHPRPICLQLGEGRGTRRTKATWGSEVRSWAKLIYQASICIPLFFEWMVWTEMF